MSRRLALIAALTAAGAFAASPASAGNVAWSVSVGVPGLAVSAGAPVFGPVAPVFGPAFPPFAPVVYGAPGIGAFAVPAPVVVAPRVFAPRVFAPRAFAPRVFAPRVFVPRRVVVAPHPYFAPRAPGWGWN
jgi:hypothetical protein